MRTVISAILLLTVLFACNKGSGITPPPAAGAITITAISPAMPYADDEITITGSGFNPDKTKDTVDFGGGDPASGIFNPYVQGQGNASKTIIVSASATQLVIKAVNPDSSASGLDYQLFKRANIGLNVVNRIRVRSNGLKTMSNLLPFKQLPDLSIETVADNGQWLQSYGTLSWMRPNDSVRVVLYGVNNGNACESKLTISCNKAACSFVDGYLTLNGLSPLCNCGDFGTALYGCAGTLFQGKLINYTAGNHLATVHCLIPANFFATAVTPNYDPGIRLQMKVTNSDGKSKTIEAVCMVYPHH